MEVVIIDKKYKEKQQNLIKLYTNKKLYKFLDFINKESYSDFILKINEYYKEVHNEWEKAHTRNSKNNILNILKYSEKEFNNISIYLYNKEIPLYSKKLNIELNTPLSRVDLLKKYNKESLSVLQPFIVAKDYEEFYSLLNKLYADIQNEFIYNIYDKKTKQNHYLKIKIIEDILNDLSNTLWKRNIPLVSDKINLDNEFYKKEILDKINEFKNIYKNKHIDYMIYYIESPSYIFLIKKIYKLKTQLIDKIKQSPNQKEIILNKTELMNNMLQDISKNIWGKPAPNLTTLITKELLE